MVLELISHFIYLAKEVFLFKIQQVKSSVKASNAPESELLKGQLMEKKFEKRYRLYTVNL